MQFESLPGFREFYPRDCARRNHLFEVWKWAARSFNFSEYDAPVLEPLELYIEKSGEEIVDQLFNFEDRGGRAVALRPEMTPSLARLVGARANSLKRPIKWFNIGEHYRYERPQKGRLRAFYQFNADILGESGPGADAELIALLVRCLEALGLGPADFRVRLSDRDLWLLILAGEGLDASQSGAVLGIIDKMERMERPALVEKLGTYFGDATEGFLERVDSLTRLRDFATLRERIEALPLEGDLRDRATRRLEEWTGLLAALDAAGVGDYVRIDLGIVRGLAYYTGFVFEAFEASGAGRALAGGGRYDGLVRKLGGPDLPAAGFAMGDVTLADLLEKTGRLPEYVEVLDFLCITGGPEARLAATADAGKLRALGYTVEYPLKDQSFGKQFKEAGKRGARFALVYGSDEVARGAVKVKDLKRGVEREFPREALDAVAASIVTDGLDDPVTGASP